jgi:iron complex outermembrane receptor protein
LNMLRVKSSSLSVCRTRVAIPLLATVALLSMRAAHADAVGVAPADNGVGAAPVAKKDADSSPEDQLQPIVVTANRRAENSQNVGAAITTESGPQIEALNITRAEDLVKLSPGISAIPNNGSAVSSYAVRGVGQADYTEEQEQPVAIYQDGVYIPNAAATGFPVYDVDHVEILRGPQGTLFGRNATGGLVSFFSNEPSPGFSAAAEYSGGDYNLRKGQGFINFGNDDVSDRFAFYANQRDGYVKNLDGPNLWADQTEAFRNQTKFLLGDEIHALLRIETWQSHENQAYYQTPVYQPAGAPWPVLLPYNTPNLYGYVNPSRSPFVIASDFPGEIFKRPTTVELKLNRQVGDIDLESTSSYQHATIKYVENTSGMPGYPHWYSDGANATTLQQEFRATGNAGALRWTAGINYFENRGTYFTFFADRSFCDPTSTTVCATAGASSAHLPLSISGKGASIDADYGLNDKSSSVFGQANYDFTDKFSGIIGARIQYDTENFNYHFDCAETLAQACETIDGVPAGSAGLFNYPNEISLSHRDSLWSGKAELQYHLSPEAMLYALVSKGTKSGGYFAPGAGSVPIQLMNFQPEELIDSEGGVKTTWLDSRLTANLDFYHYDYKSSQQFNVVSGNIVSIVSLPATFNGAELEIHYLLGHGWRLNLSGSDESLAVHNVLLCATCSPQNELPIDAPKALASGGIEKAFSLGDAVVTINYNARYEGSRYFQLNSWPLMRAEAYVVQDVSVRAAMPHGLWFQVWVNNVANRTYDTAIFSEAYANYIIYDLGPPRMGGVTVGMSF